LVSAITSEGVLFLISPTSDWRYSFWLITAVVMRDPDRDYAHVSQGRR